MSDARTFLSLFSGIGGFDLALERVGFRCVGQIELDPFCQRILAARFPHAPRWLDCREFTGDGLESPVDLLTGGFPCQGASVAGKRLGLKDDRTALFWEICRIQEIIQAPWGLFENVPGLRSVTLGRDFETVLAALKKRWPVVGWRTLDSRFFHVAQRRERVFFVCGPTEAGVAQVLFEPESGPGHPPAGREAGADVARALAVGTGSNGYRYDPNGETYVTALRHFGSGGPDDNEAQGGHLIVAPDIAATLNPGHEVRHSYAGDGGTLNLVAHTLSAEGADASEDGTGRGTPMVTLNAYAGGNQIEGAYRPEGSTVRRLTPTECARLQGFPDGWCCLCQPLETWATAPELAANRCRCPDGPQYRAYGNAVTVSVIQWIGRRLAEVGDA